jgi:hypothetical protein
MNKKITKQQAISSLRKEAQERVIKGEVMKFRLEEKTLERLLALAKKLNKPAGTLVREWVIEKIDLLEQGHKEAPEITAISIIADGLAERGLLRDQELQTIKRLLRRSKNDDSTKQTSQIRRVGRILP